MKFTEGYWLRKESVQASYASQAFVGRVVDMLLSMTGNGESVLRKNASDGITGCGWTTTRMHSEPMSI